MGYPRLVVYVRHAESVGNVSTTEQRFASGTAVHAYALTENGREQARVTGHWLRQNFGGFDCVFHSTYARTLETLRYAGFGTHHRIIEDSRLDETHFGIHHFYTPDAIKRQFPLEAARQEQLSYYWYRPFGGENWPDAELRLHSFQDMLYRKFPGKRVLIFAHGNLFRAWRRVTEGRTIGGTMAESGDDAIANCGVAVYRGTSPWYAPWRREELVLEKISVPRLESVPRRT